jgi:cytochrome bd ubiquinol oxidase subunit II
MDLNTLWYILIGVLFAGFFFLEGFDFGVGMLLPFLGKNDSERRVIISTIGPFWDGNEVWLLTAGGAIFAAFPHWYATMFSGFYLALVVMLVGLIIRGVAFEFRNRDERQGWRNFWDWMIFTGSFLPALLWGVATGNIMRGIPIDAKKNFTGNFFDLLNPYSLLGGLAFVALFLLHGAIFLNLRTAGDIMERAHRFAKQVWLVAIVLVGGFVVWGYFETDVFGKLGINPGVAPLTAGTALVASGWLVRVRREGWAFIMTALAITLSTISIFMGMYPRVLISSTNTANNLTVYNASSSDYTLGVMSWVALTFVPIMLAYQAWNYWIFRKRVSHHAEEHL